MVVHVSKHGINMVPPESSKWDYFSIETYGDLGNLHVKRPRLAGKTLDLNAQHSLWIGFIPQLSTMSFNCEAWIWISKSDTLSNTNRERGALNNGTIKTEWFTNKSG